MRIASHSFYEALKAQLQRLSSEQIQAQAQIASGLRMRLPSDDPASMVHVLNIDTEALRIQQFERNTQNALEISKVSFSALSEMREISDRAGEIGLLSAGATSVETAKTYATELNQLIEQVVRIANTKYQGQHLFAGTKSEQTPFVATRNASGEISAVSYEGAVAGPEFRIDDGVTISPFADGDTNQKLAAFANTLVTLRDTLRVPNAPERQNAVAALQEFEDGLLESLGTIGAQQTRLETTDTQLRSRFASLNGLASQEISADLGLSMVRLSRNATAYQAALQSSAQILRTSLLDYLR